MSLTSKLPVPTGGDEPLPPDPEFLEQRLLSVEQSALQTSLEALGLLLEELPDCPLLWRPWSTLAAVRLMNDLRKRRPLWSETRVRTTAAHMLGLKESTLRARLERLLP